MRNREQEIDISEFPNLKIFHDRMSEMPEWAREMIGKMLCELEERQRNHVQQKAWRERAEEFIIQLNSKRLINGWPCIACGAKAIEETYDIPKVNKDGFKIEGNIKHEHDAGCEFMALLGEGKQ